MDHARTLFIASLMAALFGCQAEAEKPLPSTAKQATTTEATALHSQARKMTSMDETTMISKATALAMNQGGALIEAVPVSAGDDAAVVVIGYHAATAEQAAECSLQIVEFKQDQPRVVEASRKMLQCMTVPSVAGLKDAVVIRGERGAVVIEQQGAKENTAFELGRGQDGRWLVRRATFNYTANNEETGEVDVISEEAAYPSPSAGVPVSDYDYSRIEKDLARKTVE